MTTEISKLIGRIQALEETYIAVLAEVSRQASSSEDEWENLLEIQRTGFKLRDELARQAMVKAESPVDKSFYLGKREGAQAMLQFSKAVKYNPTFPPETSEM